jgi:DNA adenine methylase
VRITCGDFVDAANAAQAGDFVYLDPPYAPLSSSSNFVAYSKNGFTDSDQVRVSELFKDLVSRGVSVIASNSDTDFIRDIYKSRGTKIESVSMARSINSVGTLRGHVPEVLITNLSK